MGAHDFKLNKVPLFARKPVNINVSRSAAPKLNSKRIYSANEILRLFSSIHKYYPIKYKVVFKSKNAT